METIVYCNRVYIGGIAEPQLVRFLMTSSDLTRDGGLPRAKFSKFRDLRFQKHRKTASLPDIHDPRPQDPIALSSC